MTSLGVSPSIPSFVPLLVTLVGCFSGRAGGAGNGGAADVGALFLSELSRAAMWSLISCSSILTFPGNDDSLGSFSIV